MELETGIMVEGLGYRTRPVPARRIRPGDVVVLPGDTKPRVIYQTRQIDRCRTLLVVRPDRPEAWHYRPLRQTALIGLVEPSDPYWVGRYLELDA